MSDNTDNANTLIPNSFQNPNILVDELLRYLTGQEAKCLWYATREILGWRHSIDNHGKAISLSQFEEYTGIARPMVSKALNKLTEWGILSKVGNATQRGQRWVLNFEKPEEIAWEALKKRREANRKKGRKRTQTATKQRTKPPDPSAEGTSDVPPVSSTPDVPEWYAPRTEGGTSDVHNETHIQTQQYKPSITKTSDDVLVEDSHPPTDTGVSDSRPPAYQSPDLYTVSEIIKQRFTRQQWQALGENEQAHKARKTVLAHCRAKLNSHPLAPRRTEMLQAINRATVQDYSDPGMAAAFQQVLGKLWPHEHYYTPEEVNLFADTHPPVANVYWLPGELSKFRNQHKIQKGQQTNGTGNKQIHIPGTPRDYNRDGLAEFLHACDQQPGEPVPLPRV